MNGMNVNNLNPNVFFAGMIGVLILSGVGEYLHVVPSGTTPALIGFLFGGGTFHVGYSIGNITGQAQGAAAAATSAATPDTSNPESKQP